MMYVCVVDLCCDICVCVLELFCDVCVVCVCMCAGAVL